MARGKKVLQQQGRLDQAEPGTGSLNSAEIYDPVAGTFTAITGTLAASRAFHSATLLNGGKVLFTGGSNDSGSVPVALSSAEVFDPTSQTISPLDNLTSVRMSQAVSLLNDGRILITGGTDGTSVFNTAELYAAGQLSGLTSVSIAPAAPSISSGTAQRFTATGTFSDGSTQPLSSALWISSATVTATVSNDRTNSGVAASASQGTATVTATVAKVSGSATLTVIAPVLQSVAVTPLNPTFPSGFAQQFNATGVYSDGSSQNVTSTATWSSSNPSIASVSIRPSPDSPGRSG